MSNFTRTAAFVLIGDLIVLGGVTLVGFQTHGTLGSAGSRILTTFLPLVAGWLLVAPFLGVYDHSRLADIRQVWRPFYAMVLAGPMAGFLRGLWLNSPVLPVFVLVLGGISALVLLVWRSGFAWYLARREN